MKSGERRYSEVNRELQMQERERLRVRDLIKVFLCTVKK